MKKYLSKVTILICLVTIPAGLWLLNKSTAEAQAEAAVPLLIVEVERAPVHVMLALGDVSELAFDEKDYAALWLATLEAGLSELDGVVAEVDQVALAPGLALWVGGPAPERWTATLQPSFPEGAGALTLELCAEGGSCQTFKGAAPAESPHVAVYEVMAGVVATLGGEPAAAMAWSEPADRRFMAVRVCAQSAAVLYGLREPAAPELRGTQYDPVSRATHMDEAVLMSHWLAGRRELALGNERYAARAFLRVAEERPSLTATASVVAVEMAAGWGDAAWDRVKEEPRLEADARFVLVVAELAKMRGRSDIVGRLLNDLDELSVDPKVWRMSLAMAHPEDQESLRFAWQSAEPENPEPVLLRVQAAVRAGELAAAWAMLDELERRGGDAAALRVSLAAGLERWDEALAAAEASGDEAAAVALRLASGLEVDPNDDAGALAASANPEAAVIRAGILLDYGKARDALSVARSVLTRVPGMPEALRMKALSLDALGQTREAERAWYQVFLADPSLVADRGRRR